MKKIIIGKAFSDKVFLNELDHNIPIFAKKANKFVGMIVLEYTETTRSLPSPRGWILRIEKDLGAYGHFDTLEECIRKGMSMGYEFFIED